MLWRVQHMPALMGIVNCTPDSFFDGGRYHSAEKALEHALNLYREGALILDIGGESSRPGSDPVSLSEELDRVFPVIQALSRHRAEHQAHFLISIDTTKASVAETCLRAGADIINDISMLRFDPRMPEILCAYKPYIVLNHIRGTPKTMQEAPFYRDVISEVAEELWKAARSLLEKGFPPEKIILDPGIGFGKRPRDNLDLIAGADRLRHIFRELSGLNPPWLYGMSRKSYIGKIPGLEHSDRLIPSIISAIEAARGGADILRVHDVSPTREALNMTQALWERRINADLSGNSP